jgi:outer membrane biogenesis lipoprotein LolB
MQISRGRLHPAPFVFLCLLACACGDSSPQRVTEAQQDPAQWNTIRTWSGNGHAQLDSFTSDTGALRIEWEAKARNDSAEKENFRVAIHSSISGRPLVVPIDHRGSSGGTVFVSEEPRVFFAVVDASDGFDWKVTISERLQ